MRTFNFNPISSMDDYVKTIDNFIQASVAEKRKLGFIIHDVNGDGRICPNDIFQIVRNNSEFAYLGCFDLAVLLEQLKKTKPNEIRPPGYMLKDLNHEFMA